MNAIKSSEGLINSFRSALVLALMGMNFGLPSRAQQIFIPPPEIPVTPPAVQEYQNLNNEMDVFIPAGGSTGAPPESQPFRWGILNVRPHPDYRVLYGSGIPAATNQQYATALNQLSPGFLLEMGSHWAVDYTPTWSLYSDSHFRNTLDHAVTLSGGTAYEDWTFGLSQSCSISSDTTAETATQMDQKTFLTALKASYQFNNRISTELEANQNFFDADKLQDTHEWFLSDWVNYQFWPRLISAIGAGFGYDNVTDNSSPGTNGFDATFEQIQARVEWRATDKISFQINGGLEDRQFFNGGSGDVLNPILNARIQYQPFDVTKISLTADRKVNAAYLSGETESTEIIGDVKQRLFENFSLDLNGGYLNNSYIVKNNQLQSRADDYYFVGVQLGCQFLTRGTKHGTISVFYQASKNSSSQAGYGFSTSQFGLDIGYRF